MRHKKELFEAPGRRCTVYRESDSDNGEKAFVDFIVLQPADSHDREEMDMEVDWMEEHSDKSFLLVALHVEKWFDELAPWQAPPVFGKTPFGNGAGDALHNIVSDVLPAVRQQYAETGRAEVLLGGYSLAGLFALWAGTRHRFDGIAAVSPSVWYNNWTAFSQSHPTLAPRVYLSLGDRETHTKTKIMAKVGDCINAEYENLKSQKVATVLEMNHGNHFQDNGIRTAKGFVWCMNYS